MSGPIPVLKKVRSDFAQVLPKSAFTTPKIVKIHAFKLCGQIVPVGILAGEFNTTAVDDGFKA